MPPSHTLTNIAVGVCWGLVGLVWIGGAIYNARRGPTVRERPTPDYAGVVAIIAVWLILREAPGDFWRSLTDGSGWLRALGLPLLLAATAFTVWARVVLGTMWAASTVAKQDHELHTDGPYHITRHPIYTGILGMVAGTALLYGLGRWAAVLVLVAALLELKIHAEEQLLGRLFPASYDEYRRRVPQLIPGLHVLGGLRRR